MSKSTLKSFAQIAYEAQWSKGIKMTALTAKSPGQIGYEAYTKDIAVPNNSLDPDSMDWIYPTSKRVYSSWKEIDSECRTRWVVAAMAIEQPHKLRIKYLEEQERVLGIRTYEAENIVFVHEEQIRNLTNQLNEIDELIG